MFLNKIPLLDSLMNKLSFAIVENIVWDIGKFDL